MYGCLPMAGQEDAQHKPERVAGAHADSAEQLPGGGAHVGSSDAAAAAAATSDAEDDQAASGIASGEGGGGGREGREGEQTRMRLCGSECCLRMMK